MLSMHTLRSVPSIELKKGEKCKRHRDVLSAQFEVARVCFLRREHAFLFQ